MSDDHNNDKEYEHILDEAALWCSRMQSSEAPEKIKNAFSCWLNSSERHKHAYQEMLEVWQQTGKAAKISAYRAEVEHLSKSVTLSNGHLHKSFFLATAASILMFICTLSFLQSEQTDHAPAATLSKSFRSEVGKLREVTLPDGSVATLNTNTQIDILYDDSLRSVHLIKGEAYFEVSHDPKRAFIVNIGEGSVRAVGTAFNIYYKPKETIVTITEGVVKIKSSNLDPAIEVNAMHKVSIHKHSVLPVLNTDIDNQLAWQNQQLVFRNEPLSAVILELNRYLRKPVSIQQSLLPELTVSGTFDVRKPEKMLSVLVDNFELEEELNGNQRILSKL